MLLDGRETLGFERDNLHREILRSQANRLNQSQSYAPAGRLKKQLIAYEEALGKTSHFNQRQYQYDKSGQPTQIRNGRRGGLSYRYDPIGRLLEASSSLGKELFAFDPASNIQPVSPSTANEHPNQPSRLSANEAPTSPRQKAACVSTSVCITNTTNHDQAHSQQLYLFIPVGCDQSLSAVGHTRATYG